MVQPTSMLSIMHKYNIVNIPSVSAQWVSTVCMLSMANGSSKEASTIKVSVSM